MIVGIQNMVTCFYESLPVYTTYSTYTFTEVPHGLILDPAKNTFVVSVPACKHKAL